MYLHFEDWSQFTPMLDTKGLPHDGRIIKVYSDETDPRPTVPNMDLAIVEASGDPFAEDEEFVFPGRGNFTGTEHNKVVDDLGITDTGKRMTRSLLRFAYGEGFSIAAMAAKKDKGWLIDHPIEVVDGLSQAASRGRDYGIHLDLFFPDSIKHLRTIVDIDDPSKIFPSPTAAARWRRSLGQGPYLVVP